MGPMHVSGGMGSMTGDGIEPYTPHANLQRALDTVLAELADLRQRMTDIEAEAFKPEPTPEPMPANALRHTPGW